MRNINRNMLHMKLNSAVSIFAVAAAFAVFLPPSNASAGICFLPDCQDDEVVQGDINMNINSDTEYCEKEGYTYYSSGECPQYYAKIGTCSRDDHYLKCDAVTWCKNNGYNTQTCSLPSFVNDQCPNGKPYYKGCKEDRPRACREQGYVNSCSPGRLYATSNRCPWDSSYGKCCTASPSSGCPSNYGVDCTGSASGTDACGYTCYRCCDDTCPSGTSKNYSGSYAATTECGSRCYRCKGCTSGSTSYSGDYAGSSECGTCYYCSDTCRSGTKGSASCSSGYESYRVSSTECGSGCYSCRKHTHSYSSCPSGYQSSPCGSGYTTSSTKSKSCSCGATSGTCYKCTKNSTSSGSGNGSGSGTSSPKPSCSSPTSGFCCLVSGCGKSVSCSTMQANCRCTGGTPNQVSSDGKSASYGCRYSGHYYGN